jgi:tRNA-specific 2-thiouridylase
MNWLIDTPTAALRARVKLRAGETPRPTDITPHDAGATLHLDEPALAAPGQAAVFYDGTRILGGGFITA